MDLNNKLGGLEKKHLDHVTSMQSHIQVHGNEGLVLRAQIESLQEDQSSQAQFARIDERAQCQRILDNELKRTDQDHKMSLSQRV
eukprot:8373640-Prorocentrum_lima.AAC.1